MRRIQFNSGRMYTAEGQQIIAVQADDGTVHFNDVSRRIDGFLTDRSCLFGADPGPATVFTLLSEARIREEVTERYVRGDRYKSYSPAIGRNLVWEDQGEKV